MQDCENNGKDTEPSDKLICDLAVTRRQSRSLYRNWVVVSKKASNNHFQSQTNGKNTKII